MLRVLMVLDDYGELMFLQTVLKKLGFDVDAIQNPRKFNDSVLQMNPDILVMTANGHKVKGHDLSRSLRRVRGVPRVILLHPTGSGAERVSDILVDGWLDSPVSTISLLHMIADLCSLNKQVLTDKFHKLQLKEIEEKARVLKLDESEEPVLETATSASGNFGTLQSSTMPSAERQERYQRFLSEPAPKEHSFNAKAVAEQVRALRKDENAKDLDDLERERKAFVEHLFKKKD